MSVCDIETNGELRFAQQVVPDCEVVFDVGARNDDYLTRLNETCQFHLFEPIPASFSVLEQRIGQRSNVTANCVALGMETGQKEIFPDTESLTRRSHGTADSITIQMITLDDYCRDHGVKQIDFLKIDVEGHELEVLRGGEQMIREATRTIQFEYGGTYQDAGITLGAVFEFFGDGWHFYRIHSQYLHPIQQYSPRLENFQYSNYVASRSMLASESNPLRRWWHRIQGNRTAA